MGCVHTAADPQLATASANEVWRCYEALSRPVTGEIQTTNKDKGIIFDPSIDEDGGWLPTIFGLAINNSPDTTDMEDLHSR